jgi:pimeloyl-ACP methyl ester carboxylesterase
MPYLDLPETVLFYDDQGAGLPPLVLVHGFTCAHEDWRLQISYFRSRHRVVSPDLRGHGLSSYQDPLTCTIKNCGGDVKALLEALDLKDVVLVGHSLGCRVVLQTNLLIPERMKALVLLDGSRIATGDPEAGAARARRLIETRGYAPLLEKEIRAMFPANSDPELVARTVARALALPPEAGRELWIDHGAWDAGVMEAALDQVRVSLLVLQSTEFIGNHIRVPIQPGEVTPWMQLVQLHVPQARVEIVTGVGHFAMLEAPEAVNQALARFLTSLS